MKNTKSSLKRRLFAVNFAFRRLDSPTEMDPSSLNINQARFSFSITGIESAFQFGCVGVDGYWGLGVLIDRMQMSLSRRQVR